MVTKTDHQKVKTLLRDTITLLCRNGLTFKTKFNIEAVIGVTLDDDDVFLLSINEMFKSEKVPLEDQDGDSASDTSEENALKRPIKDGPHRRKRLKRSSVSSQRDPSDEDESGEAAVLVHCKGGPDTDNTSNDAIENTDRTRVKAESDDDSDLVVFVKEEFTDSWTPQPHTGDSQYGEASSSRGSQSTSFFNQNPGFSLSELSPNDESAVWMQGTQNISQSQGPYLQSQVEYGQLGSRHKQVGSHVCDICGTTCSTRSILKIHRLRHEGKFPYYCSICGKGCTSTNQLSGHMATHTGQRQFKCTYCETDFVYRSQLNTHMKQSHLYEKPSTESWCEDN